MEEDVDRGEEITCGDCVSVEEEEGRRPRVMANPLTPSRQEIDEHMATHIPYRAWCPHCVMGRGRDMQQYTRDVEEVATKGPLIAADYGFLSDKRETCDESEKKGLTPIL
eukprot:15179555-Heterocapsa_arctica.AAC.1